MPGKDGMKSFVFLFRTLFVRFIIVFLFGVLITSSFEYSLVMLVIIFDVHRTKDLASCFSFVWQRYDSAFAKSDLWLCCVCVIILSFWVVSFDVHFLFVHLHILVSLTLLS